MKSKGWAWVPTLYFAEGLPYVAVMTVSTIMYKRLGISNSEIAFYTAWLYLPWVIKPFWSPIVDILSTRRRWVIAMQWLIAAGFGSVALALPTSIFFSASLCAFWIVAFLSATHDIAADGFYMLGLNENRQSFFVDIRSLFYRLALVVGQGALVVFAGYLEARSSSANSAWMLIFFMISGAFLLLALYHSAVLPHPEADRRRDTRTVSDVVREFGATFRTFFTRKGIGIALAFMLLYRFPEAQLLKLISPFLLDSPQAGGLGLTTMQVGIAYGTVGTIGLMLGGIGGGILAAAGGLRRWLMPMAWSMSLTCLTFVYLSFHAPGSDSFAVVNICIFLEQLGYGFGGTAYMLYLMYFSEGEWKTSHYAMCTGIMALGMMLPGMAAGWLQETIGYGPFFIWTCVCCALTILVSSLVKVPADYGRAKRGS